MVPGAGHFAEPGGSCFPAWVAPFMRFDQHVIDSVEGTFAVEMRNQIPFAAFNIHLQQGYVFVDVAKICGKVDDTNINGILGFSSAGLDER